MLTFDVKRKINTLRDILVGKVPDPKAQVEQITIALIYKFMDDMDIEGLEFGGTRQFFTGEYEKYAWTEIMKPENSGQQRAFLYAEGIEKMATNPNLPQLFRDIFRGAYIPYRDPDTLNMFLKEVSDFSYDNSEDLGNAFEYLLSIMGSQGDAGQFRTPRHIIDMMVEITAPAKNETILDPACGTAGFLISASCGMARSRGTGSACRIWQERRSGSQRLRAAFCSPPGARSLPPLPCRGCGSAAFHGYCPAWTLWGAVWSWGFRPRMFCVCRGPFPRS